MNNKAILLAILLSTSLIGTPYAENNNDTRVFNEGIEAYNDGEYQLAFRKWKSLVPEIHYVSFNFDNPPIKIPGIEAKAEYELGFLYENGLGVLKSYITAYEHYKWSEKWNYPQAQLASAKLTIKTIEGDLIKGITEEKRLKGYKQASESLSKLYENERATDKMREEAQELWNKYELYNY